MAMGILVLVRRAARRLLPVPVVLSQAPRSGPRLPPFPVPSVFSQRFFSVSRSGVALNRVSSSVYHTFLGPDPKKWIEFLISSFRKEKSVLGLSVTILGGALITHMYKQGGKFMLSAIKLMFASDYCVSTMTKNVVGVKAKDLDHSCNVIILQSMPREKIILDVMKVLLDPDHDINSVMIRVGKLNEKTVGKDADGKLNEVDAGFKDEKMAGKEVDGKLNEVDTGFKDEKMVGKEVDGKVNEVDAIAGCKDKIKVGEKVDEQLNEVDAEKKVGEKVDKN